MRSRVPVRLCGLMLLACHCASAPPPPPQPKHESPVAPVPPRCASDAPDRPGDLKERMREKSSDIQRCMLFGAQGGDGSVLQVDLLVSEQGQIQRLNLSSGRSLESPVRSCCEKALRAIAFGSFCGDPVEVRWTYQIR